MSFFDKAVKGILQTIRYKVTCQTCHAIFRDLPYSEVIQYYPNMQQTEQAELLVIDAQIHWCENSEHQVIMDMGVYKRDLGSMMREVIAQNGYTLEQVRDALIQKKNLLRAKYKEIP